MTINEMQHQEHRRSYSSGLQVAVLGANLTSPSTDVGIILPTQDQLSVIKSHDGWKQEGIRYHILGHPEFDSALPLRFQVADQFVNDAIVYAAKNMLKGVIAFDCFSTVIASIVTNAIGLPGPSFLSTFVCTAKYYLREMVPHTGAVKIWCPNEVVDSFPVYVKISDGQFNDGNYKCMTYQDLQDVLVRKQASPEGDLLRARQQFYFRWIQYFGLQAILGVFRPEDVQLMHIESQISSKTEHQIEVLFGPDGQLHVSDTGDIVKYPDGNISMFRTPWSLPRALHDDCRTWLQQTVLPCLQSLGFQNACADIEFVLTGNRNHPFELIEVNPRYSFMGYRQVEPCCHPPSHLAVKCADFNTRIKQDEPPFMRNLWNRTLLSLGKNAFTLPTRDHVGIGIFCMYLYIGDTSPIDQELINERYFGDDDGVVRMKEGRVVFVMKQKDLRLNINVNAKPYTRIGKFLMTVPDCSETIQDVTSDLVRSAAKNVNDALLPVRCEDSTQVSWKWLA